MIMRAIGSNSSASVFDDILNYINHNYASQLKLETLAPLFGYNSSYLGKLFTQKMGVRFNTYLDQVRIEKATELLDQTDMKIYEIAASVGYKNVDYFTRNLKRAKISALRNTVKIRIIDYKQKKAGCITHPAFVKGFI